MTLFLNLVNHGFYILISDKFNGNISIVNETKLELPYNISVTPAYAKEAVISGMIWYNYYLMINIRIISSN